MRIARWIPQATDIGYNTYFCFSTATLQKWLHERASMLRYTGCGRKNSPIWEGHSFGWGVHTVVGSASSNSGVRAVFSVHHGVVGRTSSLYFWGVYKKWRVAGSNTACISPPRSPDLTPCEFFLWDYLKAKVYEQRPLTLEALKEAIRQEVAAITPEMILKVMDNYRERLHQFINIQGRHLSDVLFKTRWCKTAFCVLSTNKKTFAVSSLVSNLLTSQIGEFFLPQPIHTHIVCLVTN